MILDQWGNPYQYQFAKSAQRYDGTRPFEPIQLKSIDKLIPSWDRQTLYSYARRIYQNFGPVKGAIDQRAMYAVGRAWQPKHRGADSEWANQAKAFLTDIFYRIGDVRGGMHDFVTNLFVWSLMLDRDGEVFILLTETAEGFPKYQTIEGHNICSPNGMGDDMPADGGTLRQGVVYWPSGEPKSYALCKDGALQEYLPAENVIHLFDPAWASQGRGITQLAHCLSDCRDALQSHDWERFHMLLMSSENYIEHNETGGPEDDPRSVLLGTQPDNGSGQGVSYETRAGGLVRFAKAGAGYKVEQIRNDRPGGAWAEFQERIIHSAFFGLGWPYSFWKSQGAGGGTAQRTEIAAAQRSVEDRQDLLFYAARRLCGYAIAKAMKRKDLPQSAEWYDWRFTYPAKLTIDDGRLMREMTALWKIGAVNMREMVGSKGGDLEEHFDERAEEIALRKLAAQKAAAKYGVEITDAEMAEKPIEPIQPIQTNGQSQTD
jgi:hypothetical protein